MIYLKKTGIIYEERIKKPKVKLFLFVNGNNCLQVSFI